MYPEKQISINTGEVVLQADLIVPDSARGLVIFAHGSGSSRHSPRNHHVAEELAKAGIVSMLLDLLTIEEEAVDQYTRHLRFDIALLADRLTDAVAWSSEQENLRDLPLGLFGASTGAAAAIIAAGCYDKLVKAVVSRGGRPDLASASLAQIKCPTMLIVGGADCAILDLNRQALERMTCPRVVAVVPDATHLFEEPGALDKVCAYATGWFGQYLRVIGASGLEERPMIIKI